VDVRVGCVRQHGTRAKYNFEGCKCLPCVDANRDYERERLARKRPLWRVRCVGGGVMWQVFHTRTKAVELSTRDIVEAYELRDHLNATSHIDGEELEKTGVADGQTMAAVRRHLRRLQDAGIGLRQVSRLTGVSRTRLTETMTGRSYTADRPQVRALYYRTAKRILGVPIDPTRAAPGAYIDATETWRLLEEMLAAGATKKRIAKELGSKAKTPALQLGRDRVSARQAAAVRRLHDAFWRGSARMREVCSCPEFNEDVA